MIDYALKGAIIALLPFFAKCLENFRVSYICYNNGDYGYHLDFKDNHFDKFGRERHFDLLIKNDFEFFLNPKLNTNISLKRFNKILRLGLIARFGSPYKIALENYLEEMRELF